MVRVLTIVIFLVFWAAGAFAASPESLADQVQRKYASITSFSADFTQVLQNASSKEQDTRTGRLFFAQPALIRWVTEKPERELLVVGKDAVWNAFEDEKVVYRYAVEDVLGSKTMIRFLSGKGNLKEDFHIKQAQGAPQGQALLKLTPREAEPSLVEASVWVDTTTFMLARIIIEDFYGNKNDVSLSNVVINPSLSKDLFQYAPPKGFQVLDNTGTTGRGIGK